MKQTLVLITDTLSEIIFTEYIHIYIYMLSINLLMHCNIFYILNIIIYTQWCN